MLLLVALKNLTFNTSKNYFIYFYYLTLHFTIYPILKKKIITLFKIGKNTYTLLKFWSCSPLPPFNFHFSEFSTEL